MIARATGGGEPPELSGGGAGKIGDGARQVTDAA